MSADILRAPRTVRSESTRALAAGWRVPVAAAAVVTAAAHIPVTGEHLHEALYIGVLFVMLEVVSVGLAIALVLQPSRSIFAVSSAVGALAILALVVSRTVGLPLIGDDIGNWAEPLAVVSVVAELLMTVGGALAATSTGTSRSRARAGASIGFMILTLGLAATVFATFVESSGDEHSAGTTGAPGMAGMDMGAHARVQQG